ncbi:MAG: DUF4830 domain-containing protein [Bacillota bacterium]|nr:DUF4830 domain-containing protein [Bacillota bacterium]
MFLVIRRGRLVLWLLLVALLASAVYLYISGTNSSIAICRDYLKNLGYNVLETPADSVEVIVPKHFDNVYAQYNDVQKEAGFDLAPYCGKTLTRYTFNLAKSDEPLYINIFIYNGKIVGGDICNPSLSGYMLPLK